MSGMGIRHGDDGVMLLPLFAAVTFIHLERFQRVLRERGMSRRLVKDKQCFLAGMCFLKDLHGILDLSHELLCIPPRVSARTAAWIDDDTSILDNLAISIPNNEAAALRVQKIGNMDQATTALLSKNRLPCLHIQPAGEIKN